MTTPDRRQMSSQMIQQVVDNALKLELAARAAYLDDAVGRDPMLRAEVARLLDGRERAAQTERHSTSPALTPAAGLGAAILGRYVIERELGRGGMATVYLARDGRHDREVAVKVLEPQVATGGAERFLREIRIAARLTHPHILGVHDSGESDGRLFYVMPYVAGETLRSRLTRDGALPLPDTVRLLRELADALAYAHAQGVMHRDLKPENVLLSGDHAVVADFGIAKALAAATSSGERPERDSARGLQTGRLTGTGVVIGTPAYMAPEQALGDPAMDHRSDLYALGVIAYEMLAGRHPFTGRTAQALAAAHLTETPTELAERRPDAPPALAALVMRLLAKDPAARPQNADAVRRALDDLGTGPLATQRRGQRLPFAASTVLAVVVAIVGYSVWSRPRAPASGPAAIHTVAVLPFENVGGTPNDEYFSDGLTDELAHALSRVPGLRLPGRMSTYALKGKTVAAREVGRTLDVAAYIDGAVRRAGERLRVTTQLVSTTDGKVLWDSVFETRTGDVFAVQDSLTRAVVASLAPLLGLRDARTDSGAGAVLAKVKRGTTNAEAYELYLKGMYEWHERGAVNVARSIDYFKQAIARDPSFARGYAALALAYNVLGVYVPDPNDSLTPLTHASARSAMTLDSTLADVRLAEAHALERDLRFAEAEAHYRAGLRIEPSNQAVHHGFGAMLTSIGRTGDAISELRMAVRLDPLAKSAGTMLAEAYIDARRFREAEAEARRVLAIDSTFSLALYSLGGAQELGGQPDSAARTLERAVQRDPRLPMLQGRLLFAYAAAGRWQDAEEMRAQLRRPGADRTGGALPAFADFVLGDREPLMRLIATRAGQRRVFDLLRPTFNAPGCNPLVDPLWADERYRVVMRDLGVGPCPPARPWPIKPRGAK